MRDSALAATQSAAVPLSLGSVLVERYELKALLGEGGMGVVFRAHDRELDEDIALKVLLAQIAEDVAALTRFRREVKLARRVTHRNVARTFDLGMHAGTRFLTMELIIGESLGARHDRSEVPLPEVLRVGAEIARGLAVAHGVGVVHRDLKPDNVMLADERVVITDFGIARVVSGEADVMRTGMIVGTPAYMAPEQLENGIIDGRTDVYALGTMLFELLARRPPFIGDSAISIAAQRISGDAPDLLSIAPHVSENVCALVKEMLARRREDRPDAQGVLDRIESLRGNAARVVRVAIGLPTLTDTLANLAQPRMVSVEPLIASPETTELATLLATAIASGITESRVATVAPSGDASADLFVTGTLHASADRVRVRLRVSGKKNSSVWAGHVDGLASNTLDLEDGVVAAVTDAVRMRTARDPGPADPSQRATYEKAKAGYHAFALPHVREAIVALEDLEAKKPGDPHVRTLLARCLLSAFGQMGGRDRGMLARAEELALRALDTDPTIAGAHYAVAQVRLADGELVSAIRATEESLRYNPRLGDSHGVLGNLLCESLFVNEGRRRLDLAARLDPDSATIAFGRIGTLGLIDERAKAQQIVDGIVQRSGPLSAIVMLTRLAVWWNDLEMAEYTAKAIEEAKAGAAWDPAAILMRSLIAGKADPRAPEILHGLTSNAVAPRRRAVMNEIAADYFARVGDVERSIAHIEAMSRLPSTNLLWMDACPPLAIVRSDPRFSEARAVIAARCADLWGSVGPWPND